MPRGALLAFATLPSDLASMRLLCSGSSALSTAQARPRKTMTPKFCRLSWHQAQAGRKGIESTI
jgi:hypothetical protein